MEMIANLPLEIRMIIFREIVSLNAISKDMKAELQSKWFNLFYDKAWRLTQDRQYDQSTDIVHFLRNTVNEKDIKLPQLSAFDNRIDVMLRVLLMTIHMGRLFEDFRTN